MAKELKPAETLKERNRYLGFALEQEEIARQAAQGGTIPNPKLAMPRTAARHEGFARQWRRLASAYKPVIEGDA